MATTKEIKDGKRADLDAIAVEQGLDPTAFNTVDELRAELLPLAVDADPETVQDDADEDVDDETDTDSTEADKKPVDDADRVAGEASTPKVDKKVVAPVGHANKFDEYGQPVFGKGK